MPAPFCASCTLVRLEPFKTPGIHYIFYFYKIIYGIILVDKFIIYVEHDNTSLKHRQREH